MNDRTKEHVTNHAGDCVPMCPACREMTKAAPSSKERLFQEAFGLLRRAQYLLTEACTKHEQAMQQVETQPAASNLVSHLRTALERIAKHANHQPPSGLTTDHLVGYWQGRAEGIALEARAALENLPDETTTELCPNCGKDEVGTFTADDSFLYGSSNPVRLVAKDVLFFRCMACHLEYTGEDGEEKRMEAIRAHLTTRSAVEPTRHLTESERASFDRALRNSTRVVHEGEMAPEKASCEYGCLLNDDDTPMSVDPRCPRHGTDEDPSAHGQQPISAK